MQSRGESPETSAPADPRGSEGYYYVDPTAQPQPATVSSEFGAEPGASYGGGDMTGFVPLLLIVLVLALLAGLVALLIHRKSEPEDVIADALKKASQTALAAYGPATIAAASALLSQVEKYLGPVRQLIDPVSSYVKKLDAASKGKIKEAPKGSDAFGGVTAAKLVVMGDLNAPGGAAPSEKHKEVEREMTSEEQIAAARKAIEDLAAVLMAPDFRQRVAAARRALNNPPPAPHGPTPPAAHAGGGASTGSVGPRSSPERKPRHR